jgi:hypothetical protein
MGSYHEEKIKIFVKNGDARSVNENVHIIVIENSIAIKLSQLAWKH